MVILHSIQKLRLSNAQKNHWKIKGFSLQPWIELAGIFPLFV